MNMALRRARSSSVKSIPAARVDGLVTTEAADEVLVYDRDRHHIHHLNRTSAVVWRLCDGRRSADDVARLASAELGAPVSLEIVHLALAGLGDADLLTRPVVQEARVSSQSRRTFMKRAAVAGAVTVPAIISMTAPAAAFTGACTTGCTCNSDCNSRGGQGLAGCPVCDSATGHCCSQSQNADFPCQGAPVSC